MKIDRIYVATHRFDVAFARVCVASIRYWYPDLPIYLLKDRYSGDFSTRDLERIWGVKVFDTGGRCFGWGLSKLEPFFDAAPMRFLVLDSDIVFVGPVVDLLEQSDADLVVAAEAQTARRIGEIYFDLARLGELDPGFEFRGLTFNTGQFVGNAGAFARHEFAPHLTEDNPPRLRRPDVFKNGDQGLFNYIAARRLQEASLTVDQVPFMWWSEADMKNVDLTQMLRDSPYRALIHWAGYKARRLAALPRADILHHFESCHYSRESGGGLLRESRWVKAELARLVRRWVRR